MGTLIDILQLLALFGVIALLGEISQSLIRLADHHERFPAPPDEDRDEVPTELLG